MDLDSQPIRQDEIEQDVSAYDALIFLLFPTLAGYLLDDVLHRIIYTLGVISDYLWNTSCDLRRRDTVKVPNA